MAVEPVSTDDIDDAVERWHELPEDGKSLHEYLGMTWDEYCEWVQDGVVPAGWSLPVE